MRESQTSQPHAQSEPVTPAGVVEGVREKILNVAMRLFSTKGYNGVSVREIVQAAGVTKPTLYYYFGNKEQLFERVIRESLDDFRVKLGKALSEPGPIRARLVRTCEVFLDYARENADHCRLLYNVYFSCECNVIEFDFDSYHGCNMDLITQAFADGIASKELRSGDPGLMAINLVGPVHLYVMGMLFNPSVLPPDDPTEGIVDTVLHGLANRSSGQGNGGQ